LKTPETAAAASMSKSSSNDTGRDIFRPELDNQSLIILAKQ
jgi:hypothetical protein